MPVFLKAVAPAKCAVQIQKKHPSKVAAKFQVAKFSSAFWLIFENLSGYCKYFISIENLN